MKPADGVVVAGRYRLLRRLGLGATGEVWAATQLGIERPVALKLLRPNLAVDERARARFEREARVAGALSHPGAVEVYDFGNDGEDAYIAMELLEGATLRELLTTGALPIPQALEIALAIAEVLEAAHQLPLVHRDLKPENVFRQSHDGRIRILDFGLAFIAGDELRDRMTRHGVVTGTPDYLSPEQARAEEVGPETDIYALGCILYEMLSGKRPFGGTEMDVLTRQLFSPPPPLRSPSPEVAFPIGLDELVRAMLRKRAPSRPTAGEVVTRLHAMLTVASGRPRGRDERYLEGRAARMLPSSQDRVVGAESGYETELAVVGSISADLVIALAANGVRAFPLAEAGVNDAVFVFAPGAEPDEVAALAEAGRPVISDVSPEDPERLAALLRAGAVDVVERPATGEEVCRKLRRAERKWKRREHRE